jgi:hypothetical protein
MYFRVIVVLISMTVNMTYGKLIDACVENATDDPVKLFRILTRDPDVPMNGQMHHVIVPLVLVTAYWYVVKDFDLRAYLTEAADRASEVPERICGYWGSCGSAIGTGLFLSVITRTGPLTKGKRWGQCNRMTSESLCRLSEVGGPRCCKRNAVLSIQSACAYLEREFGVTLHPSAYGCTREDDNPECIGNRCPFYISKNIH